MSGIYYKDKLRANVAEVNKSGATASATLNTLTVDGVTYSNSNASSLADLTDTAITSPSNDDVLQYDGSASKWKNVTWTAFKAKLKTYFDTIYATISSLAAHATVPLDNTTLKIGSDGSDSAVYSTCTKSTYYPSTSTLSLATKTAYDVTQLQDVFIPKVDIAEKTDNTPYLYRPSVANGDRVNEEYVGGSVGWNQLVSSEMLNNASSAYGVTRTKTQDGKGLTYSGTCTYSTAFTCVKNTTYIQNHKYLITAGANLPSGARLTWSYGDLQIDKQNATIINNANTSFAVSIALTANMATGFTVYPNIVDLTQLFGTTIADYAYTLETQTAGSGVQWLKDNGFFTESYYPYNAGSIESVEWGSKRYVGFNQWDEEWEVGVWSHVDGSKTALSNKIRCKNHIPCIGGTDYYFLYGGSISGLKLRICYYDSDKNFILGLNDQNWNEVYKTPENAGYMTFCFVMANISVYSNDICINLTKTTGTPKNGDYVPYTTHDYTLGTDTLRGIFKLVDNKIVADGDVKTSDGKIQRKYKRYNLGDYNYTYNSTNQWFYTSVAPSGIKTAGGNIVPNLVCAKYVTMSRNTIVDKSITLNDAGYIIVKDTAYTDAATFKTAMSGVYFDAELATPTTEQSSSYTLPQICDKNGTEEFVTDSIVPIGHNSTYYNYPDYMEEGEYKDFRDRVDYADEKARWKLVGIYANNETITIDGWHNEIMLVPNHYSGATLIACASPAIFPFSLFKIITLQNSTESERIDITPAGVVGVTGTYFSNVSIYVR